ncbi:MAG: hypothetical protein CMK59_14880 [Proteobacteria bacterium]|nr:hypothetical protein [Pseudomonadota bacterium]
MIILVYFSCSSSAKDDLRRNLLQSWGEDVVVANGRLIEEQAEDLYVQHQVFCEAPDEQGLEQLRSSWWKARGYWKEIEVFKFGPYKDEWRLGPKIDFWPVRVETIEELIAGDSDLTPESLYGYGASSKGFPVLDYLLYNEQALERMTTDDRYCQLSVSVSAELKTRVLEFTDEWDPQKGNYLAQLTEAGYATSSYPSLQHSLAEVVNRMGHTVENIRIDKLYTPMGVDIGSTQPDKLESPYSGRSFEDIVDNLRGIQKLYEGAQVSGALGLKDLLQDGGHDYDEAFLGQIQICVDSIEAYEEPLISVIETDQEALLSTSEKLRDLQSLIQTDIMGALSLWVSFNDTDGD